MSAAHHYVWCNPAVIQDDEKLDNVFEKLDNAFGAVLYSVRHMECRGDLLVPWLVGALCLTWLG